MFLVGVAVAAMVSPVNRLRPRLPDQKYMSLDPLCRTAKLALIALPDDDGMRSPGSRARTLSV